MSILGYQHNKGVKNDYIFKRACREVFQCKKRQVGLHFRTGNAQRLKRVRISFRHIKEGTIISFRDSLLKQLV